MLLQTELQKDSCAFAVTACTTAAKAAPAFCLTASHLHAVQARCAVQATCTVTMDKGNNDVSACFLAIVDEACITKEMAFAPLVRKKWSHSFAHTARGWYAACVSQPG